MRKYFFDKTNIRNILAITGLLFAILTFLMFFVTGSKGFGAGEVEDISGTTSRVSLIFSASLFSLVIGKGFGFNYPEYTITGNTAQYFKPGINIVLVVAFALACVVLVLAITIVIGMLYKKFNRKVLLGLSITEIVLLVVVVGLLTLSRASIYQSIITNIMNIESADYDTVIEYANKVGFKVQPAIGAILGSVFGMLGAGSGLAAVIFTRYSISNRQ